MTTDREKIDAFAQLFRADVRRQTIIECANVVNEVARKSGAGAQPTLIEAERRIMNLIYKGNEE